ncbi:uncharacterized protein N7483_005074 [Penicillium malachiteum]|uniref:uncharacterized protein n=1 Tax=Penicillium malachiteum TaxID=1324776 RepID=UPI002548FDA3|nr:uncharacterized protein N7483_005074 [Penicillium malachiteum]KAJ5730566.1 hypothetical protein N7483_005074 [Penicillium malachiteum]
MSATTTNLDSLPFDIFYQIAKSLDDRDYINLSRTNRALRDLTNSDLVARKTVENALLYSIEGQKALANRAGYTYRKAVGHRFDIHEAVATATPYSVSVLAYGADFLYNQGFLCYRAGHDIRLLNVHAGGKQERVLNLLDLLRRLHSGPDAVDRVSLLQYADGILVFRVKEFNEQDDMLLAIDMSVRPTNLKKGRLVLQRTVPASAPMFVRHSRSYLWYGVFTAMGGSDGVWAIHGADITSPDTRDTRFTLDRIVDGDLGQSLCFEMYNEHLYAVSTQATTGQAEVYSSFYRWSCYAPRRDGRQQDGTIWRREHCEGPINEMWTDLSIRIDEVTGNPVILECRREWPAGKSENHRTYYTQPLPMPEEVFGMDDEGSSDSDCLPFAQEDDLDEALTNTHRPANSHRPAKRLRRDYHAEYEPSHDHTLRQEFIAARTKHRTYNLAASTFIDLVNDPVAGGVRSQDRLRLRTVSRKRKSPIDEEGDDGHQGLILGPTQYNDDGIPLEGSEERFMSRGVHMWPPEDSPTELHRILCPDSRINSVRVISDERSILYSIQCSGLPVDHKAIILISFDPKIHFKTLLPLRTTKAPSIPEKIFPVEAPQPEHLNGSLLREAKPLYEAINWGYWLR